MGMGGISPWSLLLILLIVLLLFGTKRLRNMGGDLGDAIKNFKSSMGSSDDKDSPEKKEADLKQGSEKMVQQNTPTTGRVIDSEAVRKETTKS